MTQPGANDAAIANRQRVLYEGLWRDSSGALYSPDLIRYRVWKPHLRGRILDVGAGNGLLARSFPDQEIYSVDLASAGLQRVPHRAAVGSASNLPFKDDSFATILLSEVLEHVAEPSTVVRECGRICQPGGTFLLSVPHWPLSFAEWLHHFVHIHERPTLGNIHRWDPNHERRYAAGDLVELLEQTGWDVREVVPLFGEATSLGMYWLEPIAARTIRYRKAFAQGLGSADRFLGQRHSGIAIVATLRD
jgi:SAM-dependent methyltransferase